MVRKGWLIAIYLFLILGVTYSQVSIDWISLDELQEKQKIEPRKVIVDLYTQWCGWCKKMDQSTFADSNIASLITESYYAVRFDAESKEEVQFMENEYHYVKKYGRGGYHQLAAALTEGQLSFPTLIFMDESMNVIQAIRGYQGPERFQKILSYFAFDYHKTTPWNQFSSDFKQNIHMVKSQRN